MPTKASFFVTGSDHSFLQQSARALAAGFAGETESSGE
jgi:hypothetical protein